MELKTLNEKAFSKLKSLIADFFENPQSFDGYYKKIENKTNIWGVEKRLSLYPNTTLCSANGLGYPMKAVDTLFIEDLSGNTNWKDGIFDGMYCISFAMYGKCNGDMMRAPEFVFALNEEKAIPIYFRVDWLLDHSTDYNLEVAPFPYWENMDKAEFEEVAKDRHSEKLMIQAFITEKINEFIINL